ncbi:hypothetical protein JQM60_10015 [Butyricicoccus pullicaecorum]|nr:hypothetical protein [Butyricicoccus pullicaecorum]
MIKIAVAYDGGNVAARLGECPQYLVITVEKGVPLEKQLVDCPGDGHIHMLNFVGQYGVDVLICGELGIASRNALEMLGVVIVPGVTGSAEEAVARFLVGERQGDTTVLTLCRDDDEADDPLACMHDCAKCAGCGPVKADLDKLKLPEVK